MLTANGGGFCAVTLLTSDFAFTFSITAGPGLALVASTTARMFSGFIVAMSSERPLTVTVTLVGGLIRTRSGETV